MAISINARRIRMEFLLPGFEGRQETDPVLGHFEATLLKRLDRNYAQIREETPIGGGGGGITARHKSRSLDGLVYLGGIARAVSGTSKTHLKSLFIKMGAVTPTEAVRRAEERGFIHHS